MSRFFKVSHFKAIALKKWILIKRSWKTVLISSIATLVFSALAIVAQYLMVTLIKEETKKLTYGDYWQEEANIALVRPPGTEALSDDFVNIMNNMIIEEKGVQPTYYNKTSRTELNEWMYNNAEEHKPPYYILYGLEFNSYLIPDGVNNITLYYNGSLGSGQALLSEVMLTRVMWKKAFGIANDFTFSVTDLFKRLMDLIFGQIGPMLIACGLISIVPLIISQPILDITGEVRQYMVSCTLTLAPYWLATFLIDLVIWTITVTLVWAIFNAALIKAFHDNLFNTWYSFFFAGPSFILSIYVISFFFSSPDSASRQAFLLMIVILLIPIIVDMVRQEETPVWLEWIYSLIPHISIQRMLTLILSNMGASKQNISYYWKQDHSLPYFIMQFVDIILYGGILTIIEAVRLKIQNRKTKKKFGDYTDFFKKVKAKHPVTEEAGLMEKEVHDNHDYAVRIENVSRLFFNTANEPIPAVNCVNLGVKEGSLFGFLGANGAGKTTLIKMITSMLPPSDGTIEIHGIDIAKFNDPTKLSICPQFNNHLCQEMTPLEHFQLYSLLFEMDADVSQEKTEKLIKVLELESLKNKPIRELSGGDIRKLAIAMSFLSPADIILLDEPTASLDPVARHHVHEMILEYKGDKTFMLCTHLLSEAETLCDTISIMIKGCVYTVGTPQYLSQKFGTEFKIDVMLDDESEDNATKCDQFFQDSLPDAALSITRPKARIYSIPASSITLPELFVEMEKGKNNKCGFSYYTCSTSSLERVFMEIVRMSESEDIVVVNADDNVNETSGKEEDSVQDLP